MSQLPQPVDEALAGLAVDPAGLQHGLALLHELDNTGVKQHGQTGSERSDKTRFRGEIGADNSR